MNQLFQNILTASFHGSVVILVVMALRLVLKKTPKKFLCMLWLLAGLRLLMPFEIKSDLSLQPQPEPIVEQIVSSQIIELPRYKSSHLPQESAPIEDAIAVVSPSPAAPTEVISPVETVTVHEAAPSIDWDSALPYLWLIVASLFLVYTAWSYISLRLLVREAIKIPGGWECDRIETAFILGFIRPRIYIPMGLSKMVRKHILAHERTHLEKGDHWYKMIGFIALALHWFNPLVWAAYILLCKDIEMACDERVVQFMELSERKEYSAALLNCSTNKAHFAACPVAFGEVSVKHRIKSVLKYKKPGFWISLAGVIAIAFVALCLVTSPVEEKTAAPGENNVVRVSNVDELLSAIAPNTEILMEPGTYNLSEAETYGGFYEEEDYYKWDAGADGHQLVIVGVENLTIRGSGRLVTNLETDPRYADVLMLENCTDVVLEDFTAGHTIALGECSGGVIELQGCNGVQLNRLGLFGCGTEGLTTYLSSDITMTDCEIYECSSNAATLYNSNSVTISRCRIYDIGREDYGGYVFFDISNCQSITIENSELSNSDLNMLMHSAGSFVTLKNNLFVNNRTKSAAFSISGENVVLDGNKFDGNSIRDWYSSFGNAAKDENGNILTEEVLHDLYTPDTTETAQARLVIHVSTVDELIAAIGPNTEIVLEGELYDFSTATGYGTSSGAYYYWEDVHDGPGLVIQDVDNLVIRSNDGNVKGHTIAAIPRYADVLAFKACSNVTLSGFTAGHTREPGACAGGVIEFRDCDNMTVDNCGLYGCGILGVYAEYSSGIHVKNSEIYECSLGGIEMRDTDNITIEGNTFRDLGGEETNFIGCSNITLDGNLLSPDQPNTFYGTENGATPADEEDLVNLGHAVTAFAEALFNGDTESMRLYMSSSICDLPIEIPKEVSGSMLAASQDIPVNYPNEMETKGYCTAYAYYVPPNELEQAFPSPEIMTLEMCRQNGVWKVQYYTLEDTEIQLLDKDLYNFAWAYFDQDIEGIELFLSDSHTGSVKVYEANADHIRIDSTYTVGDTYSNAALATMTSYSAALPFKKSESDDTWSYLNIALERRENPKTYQDEYGNTLHESEWVVLDYGLTGDTSSGGIEIKTIDGEHYTGFAMIIDDPSRVFLGTSTDKGFSANTPGKRIGEMFDRYPTALAAVNAGPFFDDGTTSNAVGSYPLGLTISEGETVWTEGSYPNMKGFVGFNTDDELVVLNRNLTQEEAEKLNIRDGVSAGPALIIDREVLPAANEDSGYNLRTAIGQTEDGKVILLCTNGRVWDNLGASYREVADQMMALGAESACLLQGGSATGMMYRPDLPSVPQLYTTLSAGQTQPRRQPTYWMVAAE